MNARTRHSHRSRRLRALGVGAFFRPSLDRIPSLLALLAIVVQCFVVQAHIHAPIGGALVPSATGFAAPATDPDDGSANIPRGKFPAGDDPSNCRLCQEL